MPDTEGRYQPRRYAVFALVTVIALVSSRAACPKFEHPRTATSSLKHANAQDKRQCVQHETVDLAPPAQHFFSGWPAVVDFSVADGAHVPIPRGKGYHYNRPPPYESLLIA